jgi:beta-lactamase class D
MAQPCPTTRPRLPSRRDLALLTVGLVAAPGLLRAQPATGERADLQSVFREQGVTGTFALYDLRADSWTYVDRARAERRYVPASTFKIANSLIALEAGAVADENEIVPYGGKPQPIKAWERDMSLKEAIVVSNVPVYQEVARRVGIERYREWLARLDYGNREPGTVVDQIWLLGPLMISAVEQVRFNVRLARDRLPASSRSQAIVRSILTLETQGPRTLYGKTGWYAAGTPRIGWWSGWVDSGENVHAFCLNIDMPAMADAAKRLSIGRTLLTRLGIYG